MTSDSDLIKPKARAASICSPSLIAALVGSFFLLMLAAVPIWNSFGLLHDFNYIFWAGRQTPEIIIITCLTVVALYAAIAAMFFRRSIESAQTEHSIMMLATVFITLFGLVLMIASLPLESQAQSVSEDIMNHCDTSVQTHRLYEYAQVLQNIRGTPECAKKFSVEECEGYSAAPPYTDYLKSMESEFRCAGFCYKEPKSKKSPSAMIEAKVRAKQGRAGQTPLALASDSSIVADAGAAGAASAATYPPTLFSDSNFQTSCDGMASRDMKNFAGDVGRATFFQGIYLILIAVCTGFLKLLGFCMRKEA